MTSNGGSRRGVFVFAGVMWLLAMAAFRLTYGSGNYPLMIALLLTAAGAYGAAAYFLCRKGPELPRTLWIVLVIAAAGFRLSLFTAVPDVLSDDVYRYLWDGKLQAEGYNPYLHAPHDEELEGLTGGGLYPRVPHKSARTPYPPLSQLVFRLAYAGGQRLVGARDGGISWMPGNLRMRLLPLRILYLIAEGGIVFFLSRLIAGRRRILLYLMCPLAIVEPYAGAHIDIIGVFFLTAAFYFFVRRRYYPFLAAFVLSVLVKYVTVILGPLFLIAYLRCQRGKNREVPVPAQAADAACKVIAAGVFAFLFFLPFLDAGGEIFSQLRYYLRFWRFNGGIYYVVEALTGPRAADYIRIALTGGILLAVALRKNLRLDDRIVLSLTVFFLLAPTVYPWYLLWIVPFFALRIRLGELVLTGILFLSYYVVGPYTRTGIWRERPLMILIQYLPVYLLLVIDILRRKYVRDENRCGNRPRAE